MQTIDDATLLQAWERMRPLPRPWREVALLSAVTARSLDDVAALPIGERDRRLLELRECTLGRRLECRASCPACLSELEWTHDAAALRLAPPAAEARLMLESGASAICRPPDSRDLAVSVRAGDPETTVLARCVQIADGAGTRHDVSRLSAAERECVQAHLAAIDPQAEMEMALTCPDCGHEWAVTFDPAAFVLEEIDAHAQRLIEEVHVLASAYGWAEGAVLQMPRSRRQRYLALVRG
jgi:hypothetical protein